jgi:hypothetical protein
MSQLSTELTNLLPRSAARALRREYFVRLTTVALALATLAIVIHGVLLFPAYLYAHKEVTRQQAELDQAAADESSNEERDTAARVKAVQGDIEYLGRLATYPTASGAVRAVIGVPHPGIALSGFTFAAAATGKGPEMTVSGTASTRDALRLYVESLGQLPYVSKADLPISAYAKESQIPFTITLTGSLMP